MTNIIIRYWIHPGCLHLIQMEQTLWSLGNATTQYHCHIYVHTVMEHLVMGSETEQEVEDIQQVHTSIVHLVDGRRDPCPSTWSRLRAWVRASLPAHASARIIYWTASLRSLSPPGLVLSCGSNNMTLLYFGMGYMPPMQVVLTQVSSFALNGNLIS